MSARLASMEIVEVRRGWRPHLSVDALIDGQRYEFTRLREDAQVEVYDHPTQWQGTPRFLGYLPAKFVAQLEVIVARKAAAKPA